MQKKVIRMQIDKISNLTLKERERIAYINGDTRTSTLLAKLEDSERWNGSITRLIDEIYDDE